MEEFCAYVDAAAIDDISKLIPIWVKTLHGIDFHFSYKIDFFFFVNKIFLILVQL